jgi:hypothetical protein
VNGEKTGDFTEKDPGIAAANGQIGLQIPGDQYPQEILYKEIYLREL